MTTKQDIIDRLDHSRMDMNDFLTIKQMIKDLKPRVKKLSWRDNSSTDEDHFWVEEYIAEVSESMKYVITNYKSQWETSHEDSMLYYELEYAKEACQKHYEETILESIEL